MPITRLKDLDEEGKKLFVQSVREILKELKEVMTQIEEVAIPTTSPLLKDAKLLISPSSPSEIIGQIYSVETSNQKHSIKIQQVEEIFVDFFSEDDYESLLFMVERWQKSSLLEKRFKIIQDALKAHLTGQYNLSIPVLLTQIEGVLSSITHRPAGSLGGLLRDALQESKSFNSNIFDAIEKDILLSLVTDPFLFQGRCFTIEGVDFFSSEKFEEWIDKQGYESPVLNRHAILHGVQTNYGTEINSLRCFLILDTLIHLES